jgi:hypothetical protein
VIFQTYINTILRSVHSLGLLLWMCFYLRLKLLRANLGLMVKVRQLDKELKYMQVWDIVGKMNSTSFERCLKGQTLSTSNDIWLIGNVLKRTIIKYTYITKIKFGKIFKKRSYPFKHWFGKENRIWLKSLVWCWNFFNKKYKMLTCIFNSIKLFKN